MSEVFVDAGHDLVMPIGLLADPGIFRVFPVELDPAAALAVVKEVDPVNPAIKTVADRAGTCQQF